MYVSDESTISGAPAPLPGSYDPATDRYQPVALEGAIGSGELHVLVSQKRQGAGYRIIAPFTTAQGRTILIDRGFVPNDAKEASRRIGETAIRANLHAPEERSGFTPDNETGRNIWFARDVGAMAEALGTEPILAIVREETPPAPGIDPLPVSSEGIPNDHLQYAITWFSLAAVWLGMTLVWVRRRSFVQEVRT